MGISFNGRIVPTGRVGVRNFIPGPSWSTAAGSLGLYGDGETVSTQLTAAGQGAVGYAVVSGSLPAGLSLSSSGLLSGAVTATESLAAYEFTVRATASGKSADRTFSVSVAALPGDPYFDQTVLLMQMEGSNGSTVVTDSSRTGRTVTVNGTSKLSTEAAKFGTSSVDFVSGSNIQYSNADSSFTFGTGDFTIEFWVRPRSLPGSVQALAGTASVTDQNGILIGTQGSRFWYWYGNGAWVFDQGFGPTVTINTWYHIAVVRQGTEIRTYVDGVLATTRTGVSTAFTAGAEFTFGGRSIVSQWYDGFIDDGRVYRGLAKYTASFTPPATTLPVGTEDPNWASCILATPFETSLKDYSGRRTNAVGGNAQLSTAQKKYGTSSLRLDGTGDFVLYPNHGDFDFGSGDVTIETWVRLDSTTNQQAIISKRTNDATNTPFLLWWQSGAFYGRLYTGTNYQITGGTATANTWHHVALVRSGTTLRLFVDGTQVASTAISGSLATNTARVCIGANAEDGSTALGGYLDGLRITRAARYTAAFTPGRAVTVRDESVDRFAASTVLKLHMDGADQATTVADDSLLGKTVTAFGDASVTTTRAKFGSASAAFDGSGDYLTVADPAGDANFGADDFTVEGWFYPSALTGSSTTYQVVYTKRPDSTVVCGFMFWIRNDGALIVFATTASGDWNVLSNTVVATGITAGAWHHIALVRQGANFRAYLNGVGGSTFNFGSSSLYATTAAMVLASDTNWNGSATARPFTGSIQDFRIYRGAAKYTADFTPPTSLQGLGSANDPNWSKCILAAPMTADLQDYAGKRITVSGNAKLTTATKKFGTGSLALDTSAGSYVTVADQPSLELGSGDFTAEMWFRTTAAAGQAKLLLDKRPDTTASVSPLAIQVNSDQLQVLSGVGTGWTVNATLPRFRIGDWVHIAVTRQGSVYRVFINGVRVHEQSNVTGTLTDNATGWIIGGSYTLSNAGLNGQIDEFRLTKACRYSVNFEPPTQAAA